MSLNRTDDYCQPCDVFYEPETSSYYVGFSWHECYSPGCENGKVIFCGNCHTDHHQGGYGSCGGTWHFPCKHNHKQCQHRADNPKSEEVR